ncbi:hypothetical protein FGB62_225g09 [Gracilaria domingensis]|nr:hypothetical protein FGB62_225g09 [Gracilaria domingensis]
MRSIKILSHPHYLPDLESLTMIELPFGNGGTAALLFLIFELLVFPILVTATANAASLFSHTSAKKDKNIRVHSLSYPLWNEGLYSRQWSHALLFLLRLVCVAIPVYLETRLDFRDHHHLVTKRVQNAFVSEPVLGWLNYSNHANGSIYDLRGQAQLVFDRCSFTDQDGWVTASVGNVTYSSRNDLLLINCIDGTDKQIYRTKGELPGEADLDFLLHGELRPGDLRGKLSFSFVEGPRVVLQPSFESDFYLPNETAYEPKSVNVSVANASGFECFLPSFYRSNGIDFQFNCHNISGNVIDYYSVVKDVNDVSSSQRENSSKGENSSVYDVSIGPLDVVLQKLGTLEFRERVLVTAEHVVDSDFGSGSLLPRTLEGLFTAIRTVLYTRTDNLTVILPGEEVSQRTIVDEVIIIVGAIEVGAIVVFGLAIQLCFKYRWGHVQSPNTVDGLSQCWARSIACGERSGATGEKVINLRLRKTTADGDGRALLEPVTRIGSSV